MQGRIERIKEHLRLARIHSCGITGIIPILGAISVRSLDEVTLLDMFILFLLGVLMHFYGFVMNEYLDLEIDKKSPHLSKKPLVSGEISKRRAVLITVASLLMLLLLCFLYFKNYLALFVLIFSVCLGTLYDLLSKNISFADLLLGGWAITFFFFGAITISVSFTYFTKILGTLVFIRTMFTNGVIGDLKDVEHEAQNGVKTAPIIFGVELRSGRLHIPRSFKFYAYLLEVAFIALIIISLLIFFREIIVFAITVIFAVIMLYTMRFLKSQEYHREELKMLMGRHEAIAFLFLSMVLFLIFGVIGPMLVIIAIVWFVLFVKMLYGSSPNI